MAWAALKEFPLCIEQELGKKKLIQHNQRKILNGSLLSRLIYFFLYLLNGIWLSGLLSIIPWVGLGMLVHRERWALSDLFDLIASHHITLAQLTWLKLWTYTKLCPNQGWRVKTESCFYFTYKERLEHVEQKTRFFKFFQEIVLILQGTRLHEALLWEPSVPTLCWSLSTLGKTHSEQSKPGAFSECKCYINGAETLYGSVSTR